MEKWKIVVVLLLLGGLAAYGGVQAVQLGAGNRLGQSETPAPYEPDPPPVKLVGKTAQAWNVPAEFWMNTSQPIAMQDVKGHVTVLEFWRVGCPHCEDAVPSMNALYRKYQSRGLKMVAFQSPSNIPSENVWSTVQATVRRWKIAYPVAFDKNGALFKKYNGHIYPTLMVIDGGGAIRYLQTGHSQEKAQSLDRMVAQVLQYYRPRPSVKR
jgi:thiol-disulfide isomerase/thioredoxin